MKKIILMTVLLLGMSLFVACDCNKKESKTSEKKEIAAVQYQCPMDCEKGKTYSEPGKCPVCKMEIKEVKASDTKKEEVPKEHQ